MLDAATAAWAVLVLTAGFSVTALTSRLALSRAAVILLPLGVVIALWPKAGPQSIGTIAGLNVLATDPIALVAAATAVARLRVIRGNLGRLAGIATGAISLLLAQALLGLILHGTAAALDARPLATLIAITAYVLSIPIDQMGPSVRRWLLATAGGISAVAGYRWFAFGLGDANTTPQIDGSFVTSRVLIAPQAFVVACALMLLAFDLTRRPSVKTRLVAGVFAVVVVISQHRSVWIAAAVAAGVGILASANGGQRIRILAAAAILIFVGSGLGIYSSAGRSAAGSIRSSVESVSSSQGTGSARLDSTRQLLRSSLDAGPLRVAFGKPFGSGYQRIENGRYIAYQPHNGFLQLYLRTGLLGLALWTLALLVLMIRLRSVSSFTTAAVCLFAVYGLAYGFPLEFAPVLAFSMARFSALRNDCDQERLAPETRYPQPAKGNVRVRAEGSR